MPPKTNVPTSSAGHAPEGPEEEWILLRVVVRGMRQVAGKTAGGVGMALLAGLDHVGAAQVRARIGHGHDVMRAVAVEALGGFGVTEARDLAVIGLEVSLGNFAVALAAGVHDVQLEAGLIGAADLVSACGSRCRRGGLCQSW